MTQRLLDSAGRCRWALLLGCTLIFGQSVLSQALWGQSEPLIIAHRGASGYLPEHTLAAYALGYGQGADYIEPDLVMTRDGHLICLHDIHLESTTDVASAFPTRARSDGRYYAADFTLAEVRTLQARERLPDRFPQGESTFGVPTFLEMVELVAGLNRSTGRRVGIYPELKQGSWHREHSLEIEKRFLVEASQHAQLGSSVPVFVQSFEPGSLELLVQLGVRFPLIQLVGASQQDLLTKQGLANVAGYAKGIGPSKSLIVDDRGVVERAHAAGLAVHPYTFRADDVGRDFDSFTAEVRAFVRDYGVDGLFTDFPDLARAALQD